MNQNKRVWECLKFRRQGFIQKHFHYKTLTAKDLHQLKDSNFRMRFVKIRKKH